MWVVEGLYYPYSENKGADQLRGYCEADLRLCFRICKKPVFSRRGSYLHTLISALVIDCPGSRIPLISISKLLKAVSCRSIVLFEPREKTCLRGFRPGLTQTKLYSQRKWIET